MSPTAWTVAVLLVVAALGLAAAAVFALRNRGRTDVRLTGQTVVARAISYAALAAALALAVLVGPWGIAVLILILGSVALLEWARMTGLPVYHKVALVIANVIVVAAVSLLGTLSAPWLIAGIVLTGLAWPVIRVDTDRAVRDLGFAAVGFLSIAVLLVHGVALGFEGGEAGVVLVAALAGACAGSDIGAFLVGRRFGRTPLAARLSPAKTRAGLVGNFFGAAVGLLVFAPALTTAYGGSESGLAAQFGALAWLGFGVVLVVVIAVGSVWGDLFESAVKRKSGVKDAGNWLPGFGGMLDRIDSLLLTLPLVYWTLRLLDAGGIRA